MQGSPSSLTSLPAKATSYLKSNYADDTKIYISDLLLHLTLYLWICKTILSYRHWQVFLLSRQSKLNTKK